MTCLHLDLCALLPAGIDLFCVLPNVAYGFVVVESLNLVEAFFYVGWPVVNNVSPDQGGNLVDVIERRSLDLGIAGKASDPVNVGLLFWWMHILEVFPAVGEDSLPDRVWGCPFKRYSFVLPTADSVPHRVLQLVPDAEGTPRLARASLGRAYRNWHHRTYVDINVVIGIQPDEPL